MRKLIIALFALFLCYANSSFGQKPDYLQIKKVVIDGLDCYSTPYFNFSSTDSSLKGKVIYISLEFEQEEALSLVFFLQENQNELISKLKKVINESSEYNIKVIAEPKSFFIYHPEKYASIGFDWDGYEECAVIYIRIDLFMCMLDNQNEYKDRTEYFKKLITKSKIEKIRIEQNGEVIEIPLEFPLKKTIREIERKHNNIKKYQKDL